MSLRQRTTISGVGGLGGGGAPADVSKGPKGEEEEHDDLPRMHPDTSDLFPVVGLAILAVMSYRGFQKILHSPGASVGDDLSSHFSAATESR